MSVVCNLEGILSPPMQRFMVPIEDSSAEISQLRPQLTGSAFSDLATPTRLTDSVTLSTMHGWPPGEIEAIVRCVLAERGLHTFVKLNPTLLGQQATLDILHNHLGYRDIQLPDAVLDHDLKYDRAVTIILIFQQIAAERGLTSCVELSNILAMANHPDALPGDKMYMSGRALSPVTMNLYVRTSLSGDGLLADLELKEACSGTRSPREAAEMALMFRGIVTSAPFLAAH